MIAQIDFDIVSSILKVLESRELRNKGFYRKCWSYKKTQKFQNSILVPGIQKTDFYDFSRFSYGKIGNMGIRDAGWRVPGAGCCDNGFSRKMQFLSSIYFLC